MSGDSRMEVRPLRADADFEACAALQQLIWGEDIRELVPPALLKVVQRVGGISAGAFDEAGRLAGFVFGVTGIADGQLVHWSHMLAVRPELRDHAVGRSLKAYQREQLLAMGVTTALWTFDPLVARNAHLNLNILGATVQEYVEDMYGAQPTSRTDQVIGSDRVVVCWNLASAASTQTDGATTGAAHAATVRPGTRELPVNQCVRIEIPADIQRSKLEDPQNARAWRSITRRAFQYYLSRGYYVRRFVRCNPPNAGYYELQEVHERKQ